jgi:hypothetical protein
MTGATEPYNSSFSVAELKSGLKCTHDNILQARCHSQPNAGTSASLHPGIPVGHVEPDLEGSFPSNWGEAIIVPIFKAGKDRFLSSSYCPMFHQLCLQAGRGNGQLQAILDTRKPRPPIELPTQLPRPLFLDGPPYNTEARHASLSKQHLVGIICDIEKSYDNLAIWDSLNP